MLSFLHYQDWTYVKKMFASNVFLLTLGFFSTYAAQQDVLPVLLPPVPGSRLGESTCPLPQNVDQVKNDIGSSLDQTVVPELTSRPVCLCGGAGSWRRIAHLDMSDPNQQCPPNWNLITTSSVRACGGAGQTCVSAIFPSNGMSYSRVCGRIIAYQKGSPDAFGPTVRVKKRPTLDQNYFDGVSLTHGPAGSRQHIWSFVSAVIEFHEDGKVESVCPCTSHLNWPYQIPSFVGNNYFCETGNPGQSSTSPIFSDDPLWDGEGCGRTSTCCEFNTPPWFCTTLPQPTTDDLELRICVNGDLIQENVLVSLIDMYVM